MRIKLLAPFLTLWIAAFALGQSSDAGKSPKEALLAQDAAAQSGDVATDSTFYLFKDEHQKKLVQVIAEGDVALARLQAAVGREFGEELGTAVVHAAGTVVAADIKAATERVDADRATIDFKGDPLAVHMLRVDGAWKVSLTDMLGEATVMQVDAMAAKLNEFTGEVRKLTDLVEKHKFRSGQGVRDRVKDLHDRLFKRPSQGTGNGQGL
ncbi:MAG TPA: hypothetical protein VIM11_08725 [Tepidisphaeraceae bacterium]